MKITESVILRRSRRISWLRTGLIPKAFGRRISCYQWDTNKLCRTLQNKHLQTRASISCCRRNPLSNNSAASEIHVPVQVEKYPWCKSWKKAIISSPFRKRWKLLSGKRQLSPDSRSFICSRLWKRKLVSFGTIGMTESCKASSNWDSYPITQ